MGCYHPFLYLVSLLYEPQASLTLLFLRDSVAKVDLCWTTVFEMAGLRLRFDGPTLDQTNQMLGHLSFEFRSFSDMASHLVSERRKAAVLA